MAEAEPLTAEDYTYEEALERIADLERGIEEALEQLAACDSAAAIATLEDALGEPEEDEEDEDDLDDEGEEDED